MELLECQIDAVSRLASGKILYGAVGTGKTATVLRYYVDNEEYRDIYVITTARKRDSGDWEDEAARFGIGTDVSCFGKLTVDSWNNIDKYAGITEAFFVFDEQRVVGNGAWVQAFGKICRLGNHWVLLSATPGDDWLDYLPVFLANGYYKTKKEFFHRHVKYKHTPWLNYPVIDYFLDVEHLEELRNEVLVEMCMTFEEDSKRVLNWWDVGYDEHAFRVIQKKRWHVYEDRPITDVAEMYRLMRRCVNSDPSRLEALRELHRIHPRLIVFYNFDYELESLRTLYQESNVFEWNGHRKNKLEDFEDLDRWLYLVQYIAGAEAWNCISTDAMVLFSLNYSYKIFEQVQGRIDRMNTKYTSLYYYIFWSNSWIDGQIRNALLKKENFNEKKALQELMKVSESSSIEYKQNLASFGQNGHDLDPWEAEMEAKFGFVGEEFLEVCQI